MRKLGILLISFCFSLGACEKAFITPDPPNDPEAAFEYFWKVMDEKYSFFEFKNVNWDKVYNDFRPQVNKNTHDTVLFNILVDIMLIVKDGHITLNPTYRPPVFWGWFLDAPENYNREILLKNYLSEGLKNIGPLEVKRFDDIGYVHYYNLSERLTNSNMEDLINELRDTKGVVVDIRHNPGGEVLNAILFASYFNDQTRVVGYWLFKNGPGHNDFTNPVPYYLNSAGNSYKNPIVVITNRLCYSATNDLAMMLKSIPGVTLLGDTTGGGGGIPMQTELPNGWLLGFPTTQTLDAANNNVENGIAPHISITMKEEDIKIGKDPLLEKALQVLN
jgi:hypothetical protein